MVCWNDKIDNNTSSALLAGIKRSICSSKSPKFLHVTFPLMDSCLWVYDLVVWSNSNFLHNSQWIAFPSQSGFVLHSFFTSAFFCYVIKRSYQFHYFLHKILLLLFYFSQYSSQSKQCCSLGGICLSSDFKLFHHLFNQLRTLIILIIIILFQFHFVLFFIWVFKPPLADDRSLVSEWQQV